MPELPEVETVARQLNAEIAGKTIKQVEVRFGKRLVPGPKKFVALVTGKKIIRVERRAKILLFKLSSNITLVAHLKMTGGFFIKPKGTKPSKHAHVIFHLSDGREVHWEDVRKFGYIKVYAGKELDEYLQTQSYGPEPLEKTFTWQKMALCLRSRPKKPIKPLLMEQTCIAGIGNIYAGEAVWFAKLHPLTKVADISDAQMKILHRGVVDVLKRAIPARGSSADSYLDVYGQPGTFVPKLKVYGRAGQPCSRCGTLIKKIRLLGRGTEFCPICQKQ
jgi:formamidopyrimidine-DNA glycosylase